jgi:hypothetical protein
MPEPDAKLDQLLRTAIEQTRLLRLRYRNKDRIVEPQPSDGNPSRTPASTYAPLPKTHLALVLCIPAKVNAIPGSR